MISFIKKFSDNNSFFSFLLDSTARIYSLDDFAREGYLYYIQAYSLHSDSSAKRLKLFHALGYVFYTFKRMQ